MHACIYIYIHIYIPYIIYIYIYIYIHTHAAAELSRCFDTLPPNILSLPYIPKGVYRSPFHVSRWVEVYVCICMYVCMYVCVGVYRSPFHVSRWVEMYMCICMYVCMYVCMCGSLQIAIPCLTVGRNVHVYMYVCTPCFYMYVCMYAMYVCRISKCMYRLLNNQIRCGLDLF